MFAISVAAAAQALDGDAVIGPDYAPAPELTVAPGTPRGTIIAFTMRSEDSKSFPGVKRIDPGQTTDRLPDTQRLADPAPQSVVPAPYTRDVWVYVPAGYVPGTPAPFMIVQDGRGYLQRLPPVLDTMIAAKRLPPLVAVMVSSGGGSARGGERNLEYDTLSGRYSDFIEGEVLPKISKDFGIAFTRDPEGRGSMGGSSGGIAAFTMAWFHPMRYRRVISYSGSFTALAWPRDPANADGGWNYPKIVEQNPKKPLRIWLEVGDKDLRFDGLADAAHLDWPLANQKMAQALKAKGYAYRFVWAKDAGHVEAKVYDATLPEALEWVWKGYPK